MKTETSSPRILVIKLSSLGDIFHPLPAVHLLKTAWDARVDWVTQPEYTDLVRCFTDVDRVIAFPRQGFVGNLQPFLKELRRETYDTILDFQGLLKSAIVARMARGKMRLGPSFHREGSRVFYSAVAGKPDRSRHAVEQCLDTAHWFGEATEPIAFPIQFPDVTLEGAGPHVALVPVSRWETKNWPVESFAVLAKQLHEQTGAVIHLVGGSGKADQNACRIIAAALPEEAVVNHAGTTTLPETGGLLQKMDLLIANDTGPVHMAAAVGTPTLVIFGPTEPARTGPYGTGHQVLIADSVACRPCFSRACATGDLACLTAILPETVAETAQAMLLRE